MKPDIPKAPLPRDSMQALLETSIRRWGERVFALMESAGAPSLFSAKGFYGALMDWSMKDEDFKVQLFRFVDVLPALKSAAAISHHLKEYLDNNQLHLAPALRAAVKAMGFAGGLVGGGIKSQVAGMARMFMLGSDLKEVAAILKRLHEQHTAFTVDVLGEAVVSEKEADEYAARYLDMINFLARETAQWLGAPGKGVPGKGRVPFSSDENWDSPQVVNGDSPQSENRDSPHELTPRGKMPLINISLKISALYSQIHPADPETALQTIAGRLRPLLRRARELGAQVHFDMESYALKNLTLRMFKMLFSESEFAGGPECGLTLQAYLKDSQSDLREVVVWARAAKRRITIRLVKGAYWDYETVVAWQRGWSVPVFENKARTDANYEQLSLYLLENEDAVTAALGSHNVRSIAHALAQAERLGLDPRAFEFQVLFGMADAVKTALLQLGCRVREYCPVGELLPGMAYLVRRLLENTSNEGFIANRFVKGVSHEALLGNPAELVEEAASAPITLPIESKTNGAPAFTNEPLADFTIAAQRDAIRAAIGRLRSTLGGMHGLVINNRRVETQQWDPSLNPANQEEVIGYAARATVADAEAALAAARAAQGDWGRTSVDKRADLCNKLSGLLRRDRAALTALSILEAGKNWSEADADVVEAIDFCNFYAAVAHELGAPRLTQSVAGESNHLHWLPRGVGVVISPWNFPLSILTGMMSAAVVAGNAVVIKPSERTPVIAARLMDLVLEAGFPPGVVNLLTGLGREVGAHLAAHPRVDFIAFTGSRAVGLNIWETAGRTPPGQSNLKKVVCEMGGKNAMIVDADADLDEAVLGALQSAFSYSGQKCSALARLIVLADNYERFLERLIAATASLRVGPAELPGNIIGPVIDRAAQQGILQAIEAGRREATLAWQGSVPEEPDACYVPPTIFTGVPPESRLFREEIFGPVLCVTQAKDFDEALALSNDCAYALTGGLYSRSPVNIERAKAEMVCGNLYVNRGITGAIVGRQPFGGFKMSGSGTKAGGVEYLQHFLVPRIITENCLRRGFAPKNAAQPSSAVKLQ
jgi:RHH-type transcriptional regulator, proline utilization regulon repressor / proline dehydrogenase / delta 1-pyrroline-5-carboxylate dehydrogenase